MVKMLHKRRRKQRSKRKKGIHRMGRRRVLVLQSLKVQRKIRTSLPRKLKISLTARRPLFSQMNQLKPNSQKKMRRRLLQGAQGLLLQRRKGRTITTRSLCGKP